MPILKTCNNCEHYDDFGSLCVRGKELSGYDPVTGNEQFKYKVLRSAREERRSILPWHCGKNGRYFKEIGNA